MYRSLDLDEKNKSTSHLVAEIPEENFYDNILQPTILFWGRIHDAKSWRMEFSNITDGYLEIYIYQSCRL